MPTASTDAAAGEARAKLLCYADIYGEEIHSMSSEQAWAKAKEYSEQAKRVDTAESIPLLIKVVQYQAIAQCLKTLGK